MTTAPSGELQHKSEVSTSASNLKPSVYKLEVGRSKISCRHIADIDIHVSLSYRHF